jgi:hypothetical protein
VENNAGAEFNPWASAQIFSCRAQFRNTLDARIKHFSVKNASVFGIWVNGGIGSFDGALDKVANGNGVNAVVTDTVTGTLLVGACTWKRAAQGERVRSSESQKTPSVAVLRRIFMRSAACPGIRSS